ncbi:MAG TPA: acyltransferase [Opitutaceae bacterium]|jgi:acetyltransferase-like isoleucine patch superfamily enzyme|nr:acyltransferase [Opitutaceae bacterium]
MSSTDKSPSLPGRSLLWLLDAVVQPLRRAWLRATGVKVGRNCAIGARVQAALGRDLARTGQIKLGASVRLSCGVMLHPYAGHICIDRDVFLGPYCVIYGHGGIEIGPETLISMHCCILSSSHAIPPPAIAIRTQGDVLQPTRIGRDVWLGAGVTVLGGVTIGDGCIVGAGAVVSHDLPPFSIAVGIPARVVRQRG